ncbi:ABC transporter permease [Thermalbibacter longus]|nr:ABC transporter permease [Thermalbibacter longus]
MAEPSQNGLAERPPRRTWQRIRTNPRVVVSGTILLLIGVMALLAPWISPQDPFQMNTAMQLQGPSWEHPFGTDEYGRDLMARVMRGSRSSLIIALSSVALASVVGVGFGIVGGYFGGFWEFVTMRTVDVLLTIPPILLAIAVVAFLGPSRINLVLVIGFLYMTRFARLSFASVVQVKQREFLEAARVIGARTPHIILTAILPNILAPIFVQISLSLGFAILLESGLSFLGLGTPPPEPTWGNMIGVGRGFMQQNGWYVFWPALAISITILCCNMLGDGLRDALDPRLRE